MNNIVTYCRVSTEEQKKQGFSLAFQKECLYSFAKNMGYCILRHYEEDYSAKTFDRPQWKKLKHYCDKHHTLVDKILFTRWDRFSRNAKQAYEQIAWFEERNIEIYSVDNPLDLSLPESKITLALYLTLSEIENDRLSIRVKNGLKKATKQGCWTVKSPFGYTNYRSSNNKPTLIPDENAHYVLDTFMLLLNRKISIRKVWMQMRRQGMLVSSSQFYRLIRNPVYIGKVILRSNEGQKTEIIEGLHSPIIPTSLFEKVQENLKCKSKVCDTRKGARSYLYPLRGYIKCSKCGKPLTASASTGTNPNKKYYYYHCRHNVCRERFSVEKAHKLFNQYLEKISIDKAHFNVLKKSIKKEIQKQEKSKEKNKQKINNRIAKFKDIIAKAEDRFFEGLMDPETFKNSKVRYIKKIKDFENEIVELNNFNPVFEFQSRIEKIKKYIDLPEKYNTMGTCEKRTILESIITEKITLNFQ